jgi:hypothetical protein
MPTVPGARNDTSAEDECKILFTSLGGGEGGGEGGACLLPTVPGARNNTSAEDKR